MTRDMTKGSPIRLIIAFSIPMLIGNIFQQIYNFVDAAVVGRFVSSRALAAVGSTGTIMGLMVCLMVGLTNGAGVIISQCCGRRDYSELKRTVAGMICITAVLAVVTSVVGVLLSRRILMFLNTPDDVINDAVAYINIIFAFTACTALYNASSAVLRSMGDSRTPLYALIIASVMNAVLDVFLVAVMKCGVKGAAWATVLSQIASGIYCVWHIIRHRSELHLDAMAFDVTKQTIRRILRTGIPTAMESCLILAGSMSVQRLVNSFGSDVMAGFIAATKIDSIAMSPIISVGAALSVFAGQNMGARNIDRLKKALYQTMALLLGVCIVLAAAIVLLRNNLLGLLLDKSDAAESIAVGGGYLSIVSTVYVIAAVMRSYLNLLCGSGDVNTSAVAGGVELLTRIVFAYILVIPFGVTGIWIATPIAWIMSTAVVSGRYYSGKWKTKSLLDEMPCCRGHVKQA